MVRPQYEFILYKYSTENLEFLRGYQISDNGILQTATDDKYCVAYFRPVTAPFVTLPQTLRVVSARLIELKVTTGSAGSITVIKTTPLISDFTRLVERVALQAETTDYHIEYYAINDKASSEVDLNKEVLFYEGSAIMPHYKTLSKKYSKESGQQFFRESFEGKLNLFGSDYEKVSNASLNTRFALCAYKNNKLYLASTFNKIDCQFDRSKKSVELKLTIDDAYSLLLSRYEDTHDLIKLAPAISQTTYEKRPALQLYIQGASTVSTYYNGLYEEQEASEIIEDDKALRETYHFGEVQTFEELNFIDWPQMQLQGLYLSDGKGSWVATDGTRKFTLRLEYAKGFVFGQSARPTVHHLTTDKEDTSAYETVGSGQGQGKIAAADLYSIVSEGFSGYEYISENLYTITKGLFLTGGETGYKLIEQGGLPSLELASFVTKYHVWARVIGDSDDLPYDLASDDFAMPRANYKKCVGVAGKAIEALIYQSPKSSIKPTKYGLNDYGEYFTNAFFEASVEDPYTTVLPLGRSAWVNSSLWALNNSLSKLINENGEYYETKYIKDIKLTDSFHLADVIKALLKELDPSLTHEATEEYSAFLYSSGANALTGFANYDYLIAPKSNILKGNYDQAAQKAEITFKDLMEMLRDCFRCYWFIDEQKRFRIEHILYFTQGGSYTDENIITQLDLTALPDMFNKKRYSFFQNAISFDKEELVSRYEFSWMDDSSDAMGNIAVDINDSYVQRDKTESITASKFSTDLDLMLLFPNNFSSDGFALIAVDKTTRRVPAITTYLWDEVREAAYAVNVQNFPVSWHRLINNYLYDMPGKNISYNTVPPASWHLPTTIIGSVQGIKKCMTHDIQFPVHSDPSTLRLIRTEIGDGAIDEMLINFDTQMVSTTLRYYPE